MIRTQLLVACSLLIVSIIGCGKPESETSLSTNPTRLQGDIIQNGDGQTLYFRDNSTHLYRDEAVKELFNQRVWEKRRESLSNTQDEHFVLDSLLSQPVDGNI